MARPQRSTPGGYCYHVLSRGNARQQVFHKPGDFEAFVRLFDVAHEIVPMRVLAYCLMPRGFKRGLAPSDEWIRACKTEVTARCLTPFETSSNHIHLVLWPREDGDVSRWMQWLLTTHVRRYHKHHRTSGHVWQGRFKSFPIQEDGHLLAVMRYVERNALRAGLAADLAAWPYSSLTLWNGSERPVWHDAGPVRRGNDWPRYVAQPQTEVELVALRRSVERGVPYGSEDWQRRTITALGLEGTLRPRGRPRKSRQ